MVTARKLSKKSLQQVVDFWWGEGLAYQAPALAFYLIISLAPLALGLTALTGIFFSDVLDPERVSEAIADTYPVAIQDDIIELSSTVADQSMWLLLLSLAAMLWTSSSALGVIERTMTKIMSSPQPGIIWGRARLVLLGMAFAIVVIAATFLATLASGAIHLSSVVFILLNLTGMSVICAFIYQHAALRRPRFSSCLLGALPAAVTLQFTPYLVGKYFSEAATISPASLFFSIGVIVASCYLLATGIIAGAGLAARRG